jgi:hypothetical protein
MRSTVFVIHLVLGVFALAMGGAFALFTAHLRI